MQIKTYMCKVEMAVSSLSVEGAAVKFAEALTTFPEKVSAMEVTDTDGKVTRLICEEGDDEGFDVKIRFKHE